MVNSGYKICPVCGEEIKAIATKCKHCLNWINDNENEIVGLNQQSVITIGLGKSIKIIGTLLIILGVIGIFLGSLMFGDIGVAAMIGATSALLSGFGFFIIYNKLK